MSRAGRCAVAFVASTISPRCLAPWNSGNAHLHLKLGRRDNPQHDWLDSIMTDAITKRRDVGLRNRYPRRFHKAGARDRAHLSAIEQENGGLTDPCGLRLRGDDALSTS